MSNLQSSPPGETPVVLRSVVLASADAGLRSRLNQGLTSLRWNVQEAVGGADALARVDALRPEALLLDHWLPDLEVGEFFAHMVSLYPGMDVLHLDGSSGREQPAGRSPRRNELLHALRMVQDEDAAPVVPQAVRPATVSPGPRTAAPVRLPIEPLPGLIGDSRVMRELAGMVRLVAPRQATVLIEGETGTGKEVVAKAIHRLSTRSGRPCTVLNCAAIPESLLEAELFGHTRGAFTGAVQSRMGRIEAAHGGTLFLDEIGEMPLALQAKMLRFLECGELQRVGENETLRVDVRVIAATHQHLEERAAAGTFRLDLYHRLAVFPVEVPPLREHGEDLAQLADHFIAQLGKEMPVRRLAHGVLEQLQAYSWPGNVRELKHVLERAAILAGDREEIRPEDLRFGSRRAPKAIAQP